MNKFKSMLHSWSGLGVTGRYNCTDTFKTLPASVAGANGAMHRYVSALLITSHAHFVTEEMSPPDMAPADLLDFMIGQLVWTRYGGSFVPAPLTATEIAAFLAVMGCVPIDKQDLLCWVTGWDGDGECDAYASILVPLTPTMFSTGHSRTPTDAPWAAATLGSSSQYTIQAWKGIQDLQVNESEPETVECTDLTLEVSAMCLDTPRVILCRPLEYRKLRTTDDPAVLPSQFCKMPTIFCASSDLKKTVAAHLSDTILPIVRVDGRQMQERMPGRVFETADWWYRDDADRFPTTPVRNVFMLRQPFESSKMILQPAGSQWSVENLGNSMVGAPLHYYYMPFYEPSGPLISYQLGQMGVSPEANRISNVKVNSNSRGQMSMTEEESVGLPQTLGEDAFNG